MSDTIRVVIADDFAVIRAALAAMLSGYPDVEVVGQAGDWREAVQLAMSVGPHVVLMDVNMPRVNGIEATREIVACCPVVKVMGLSMHDAAEVAQAMRDAGAVAYVPKASDAEVLLAAIRAT